MPWTIDNDLTHHMSGLLAMLEVLVLILVAF